MVRLGILGIPSNWDADYLPALEALAPRVEVSAVFDHIRFRAERVAQALHATAVGGTMALVQRRDVDGVLLLQNGWYGSALWSHISKAKKPVFLGDIAEAETSLLEELHAGNVRTGALWMPQLNLRYFPATYRLMELQATVCGVVESIRVEFPSDQTDRLYDVVDWCRFVSRGQNISVRRSSEDANSVADVQIETRDGRQVSAEIRRGDEFAAQVICANGKIERLTRQSICWQANKGERREDLSGDRHELQVMLDHFCRRVAGGLLPVPNLDDLHIALAAEPRGFGLPWK